MRKIHIINIILVSVIVMILGCLFVGIVKLNKEKFFLSKKQIIHANTRALANALKYYNYNIVTNFNYIQFYYKNESDHLEPDSRNLNMFFDVIKASNLDIISILFIDNSGQLATGFPEKELYKIKKNNKVVKYIKERVISSDRLIISAFFDDNNYILASEPLFDNDKNKVGYVIIQLVLWPTVKQLESSSLIKYDKNYGFFIYNNNLNEFTVSIPPCYDEQFFLYKKNELESILVKYFQSPENGKCILKGINGNKIFLCSKEVRFSNNKITVCTIVQADKTINYSQIYLSESYLIVIAVLMLIIFIIILIVYNETIMKKLDRKINRLEIEIDKKDEQNAVKNITESQYFNDLLKQVHKMKK